MYAIVDGMAGQWSVRKRPLPRTHASRRWLGVLVAFLTLFAPMVPHAAAARADLAHVLSVRAGAAPAAPVQLGARAAAQRAPNVLAAYATARSAERQMAAAMAASEDDDADESPRDDQTVRNEPAMPALAARAVLPDECPAGVPAPVGSAERAHAGDETPPTSVFRCNPDGRGPPRRP